MNKKNCFKIAGLVVIMVLLLILPLYQKAPRLTREMNSSIGLSGRTVWYIPFGTGFRTINQRSPGFQAGESSLWPGGRQTKMLVGGELLKVEIMRTEKERTQGLSERKFLCSDCGMLFIFDRSGIYPFWMRRMYFDIDILWLAGDEVVDITYGAKAPSKEEFDAPNVFYTSREPVDRVLEVNAGWSGKNGIKIRDKIEIR